MRKHGPPRDPAASDASRAAEGGSAGRSGAAATDGRRGGGWVVLQTALMLLAVVLVFLPPFWPRQLSFVGIPLALAGAVLFLWSARALGKSLTPYPRPRETGELIEEGPYRFVRHPIYVAGMLFFLGLGLASSLPATIGACALALLWWRKAAVEEEYLVARFPEYDDYRRRVRWL